MNSYKHIHQNSVNSLLCCAESSKLQVILQNKLSGLFAANGIDKYLLQQGEFNTAQMLICNIEKAAAFPNLKLSYSIWLSMKTAHRHDVLAHFQQLLSVHPDKCPGQRKTLVFCAVFIHELANVLPAAAKWPN